MGYIIIFWVAAPSNQQYNAHQWYSLSLAFRKQQIYAREAAEKICWLSIGTLGSSWLTSIPQNYVPAPEFYAWLSN